MCEFFALVSDGNGKVFYFDAEVREKIFLEELDYEPDSHTSIADYYGFRGAKEDTLNKYEYNPFTGLFTIDQTNVTDDSAAVERFCRALDFTPVIGYDAHMVAKLIDRTKKIRWFQSQHSKREEVRELVKQHLCALEKFGASQVPVKFIQNDAGSLAIGETVARHTTQNAAWDVAWDAAYRATMDTRIVTENKVWDVVWDAAKDAAGAALRDATWDVAWHATYRAVENSLDFENPFEPLLQIWELGYWPIGIVQGEFLVWETFVKPPEPICASLFGCDPLA